MRNKGLVEDDGTKWPERKRWRRIEKEGHTSLDAALEALIQLNYAQNENQAVRILALRAVRENPQDIRKLIQEAKKIEETKKRLLKIAIGTRKTSNAEDSQ